MAGKVVKDISQDFLNCCICMNQFKTPKMLPCIHSFCEGCFEKYAIKHGGNEIPCPTCRKICKLPETGVKGLQTNFHLINLAEKVNLLEKLTSSKKKTQVCDSCTSAEIVAYCLDCSFAICSKCQNHHAMFPILRSHSVIPIKQLNDPKFQQEWKNAKSPFCGLHSSEKLRFYCKTCSQLICRDCTIVQHSKHDCTEAVSQFDNSKGILNKLLENSNDQLDKGLQFIKDGEEAFQAINVEKKRIESEITKHCHEMVEKITKLYNYQKREMLGEITELRTKPLESQVHSAKDWVMRMKSAQKMTEQVIEENNPWELLAMSTELTNAFDNLQSENGAFEWGRTQLRLDIIYTLDTVPDVRLVTYYFSADVVVSDTEGNFILGSFDNSKKLLSFHKVMKSSKYKNIQEFNPYNWPTVPPAGAKLVVTVGWSGYVFAGLGDVVVQFSSGFEYMTSYTLTGANRNIQCLVHHHNQPYIFIADDSFVIERLNDNLTKGTGNKYTVAATSPIEFIFPGSYHLLYFTKDDCLMKYNWDSEYDTHNIDPPEEALQSTTKTCCLKGTYNGAFVSMGKYTDWYSAFLMWTWDKTTTNKNTGKKSNVKIWVIKEYCTKERKVMGVLGPSEEAEKSPAALFSVNAADGGMEIHMCDNLRTVTTYKRGVYRQQPEKYEKV